MRTLRMRGWSPAEVERVQHAKHHAPRTRLVSFLDKHLIWFVVLVAILCGVVSSVVFIPLLLTASGIKLFAFVCVVAACFGMLYAHLLSDFEGWSHHHDILTLGIVPAILAMVVLVVTGATNHFASFLMLPVPHHSPLIVSLLFGFCFLLPRAVERVLARNEAFS